MALRKRAEALGKDKSIRDEERKVLTNTRKEKGKEGSKERKERKNS